ncbi:Glycosyl transferase [Sphingomonas antarctica]|uniref:hypothetical protein n=1 Tax=Sphingomonas antarctica TaxID=2040274 RepID=UPI0039EBB72F
MKRVAFLYNHDAPHQVAHLAGTMSALASDPGVEVTALVARPAAEAVARRLSGPSEARIQWQHIEMHPVAARFAPLLDRLFPFSRLMTLRANMDLFARYDAIVSSERTCLRIKHQLGARSPQMIYVPHGSGDRNVAHHPALRDFDLHLVSGQKLVDVGLEFGIIRPDNWRITGYSKFDGVDLDARPKLFANDNPVILYNPHFDPHLSSVYAQGEDVLDLFARRPDFNLIFAPHVMYGRKRWHFSLEFKTLNRRWDVPERLESLPNILIDLGSQKSIDMTYTRAADVYLGDVSSQVYEFLARPRATIFLKSHDVAWRDHPDYQFWHNGPVIDHVRDLEPLLDRWQAVAADYRATQQRLFAYTVDMTAEPASVRGARAIADYVGAL